MKFSLDNLVRPDPPPTDGRTPFITGSFAYGTPHSGSDIDMVVRLSNEMREFLLRYGGVEQTGGDYDSVCFGQLNLICCADDKKYDCWRDGTAELRKRTPVTRMEAVAHFRKLRGERGVS